ncbi:acetyltransferase [Gluconacetobacter johannae DSM 13595]|uniref:GNAT family N-acetyltransferase n=1 Tax=Gluconacetobacter johannae TaxID=112140 RepID=A0A7W4J9T2_9PROT|nr:GNAT family N-acetyltransferase [Gluconacetobacter johannae]MBB2177261.1 GNAT family N-acetyltransferase [Gluconacetobacter johannae]GBQ83355.1 acetyltransferase [Gluconacetobacter johannae DSM 13595]
MTRVPSPPQATLRAARPSDAPGLPAVERSAGASFLALPDLAWIASHDVMPAAGHLEAIAQGTCWVSEDATGLTGFLTAGTAAGDGPLPVLHIRELSVRADRQGQGLGRRLLDHAAQYAATHGLSALTLTTFRDVPWNAPFYARAGFALLDDAALTPRLRAILADEAAHGLPRRCAMRRAIGQGQRPAFPSPPTT